MSFAQAARVLLVGVGASLAPLASAAAAGTANLVEDGRRIFFTETFGGNGRTCGSCHPADNNYTIDPAYIAGLPATDPLFVNVPGLERPKLLRQLGLVVVHADGFDKPGVLRGVPTLLGIRHSLLVEPGSLTPPGAGQDLAAATGWSGDGAPGSGSLNRFARGAVKEHLTRSAARVEGRDFRFPTQAELDALSAFMRSLGRPGELDIEDFIGVTFRSPLVERGRALFNNEVSGPCAFCHLNATALNEGRFNGMFDIGVAQQLNTPARRLDPTVPGDGGFGASPQIMVGDRPGYGDGRFNTASLIEAADTVPSFHDNSAATIEAAVRFYTTQAFADSPEGQARPIQLDSGEVVAIAALLRTLNAVENIRASNEFLRAALGTPTATARSLLPLALADTSDAITVLTGGPRQLYANATSLIRAARLLERVAARTSGLAARDDLLRRAIELKELARGLMFA